MLKIEKMDLTLGRGSALERVLFNQFSFTVAPGEFVIIIGGNGSGKSTLMNIISGFQGVDSGAILLDGKDVTHSKQQARSRFVSHVMQDPKIGTMESMTIEENMSFALLRGQRRGLARHNTNARRALFKAALHPLGMNLENRLNDFVGSLSGGQRQGLALVMATLSDSKILLLDEITAALDPTSATNVMQLAADFIRDKRMTAIMITHNMNHALRFGGRTLLLKDGQVMRELSAIDKSTLTVSDLLQIYGDI